MVFRQDFNSTAETETKADAVGLARYEYPNLSNLNYYQILGISEFASQREIKIAYRKQALRWHADKYRGTNKEYAKNRFIKTHEAYQTLFDSEQRLRYDRITLQHRPAPNTGLQLGEGIVLPTAEIIPSTKIDLASNSPPEPDITAFYEELYDPSHANRLDPHDRTMLYYAADLFLHYPRWMDAVKMALIRGSSPHASLSSKHGDTTLAHLVFGNLFCETDCYKNIALANTFLEFNADPFIKDSLGNTCIHAAFRSGKLDIMRTFLNPLNNFTKSFDLTNDQGETPLHVAAYGEMQSELEGFTFANAFAKIVLKMRLDSEARDYKGNTPLLTAAEYGNFHYIKFLIRYLNADHEATNNMGEDMWFIAAERSDDYFFDWLMGWKLNGVDFNRQDNQGRTLASIVQTVKASRKDTGIAPLPLEYKASSNNTQNMAGTERDDGFFDRVKEIKLNGVALTSTALTLTGQITRSASSNHEIDSSACYSTAIANTDPEPMRVLAKLIVNNKKAKSALLPIYQCDLSFIQRGKTLIPCFSPLLEQLRKSGTLAIDNVFLKLRNFDALEKMQGAASLAIFKDHDAKHEADDTVMIQFATLLKRFDELILTDNLLPLQRCIGIFHLKIKKLKSEYEKSDPAIYHSLLFLTLFMHSVVTECIKAQQADAKQQADTTLDHDGYAECAKMTDESPSNKNPMTVWEKIILLKQAIKDIVESKDDKTALQSLDCFLQSVSSNNQLDMKLVRNYKKNIALDNKKEQYEEHIKNEMEKNTAISGIFDLQAKKRKTVTFDPGLPGSTEESTPPLSIADDVTEYKTNIDGFFSKTAKKSNPRKPIRQAFTFLSTASGEIVPEQTTAQNPPSWAAGAHATTDRLTTKLVPRPASMLVPTSAPQPTIEYTSNSLVTAQLKLSSTLFRPPLVVNPFASPTIDRSPSREQKSR